MDIPDKGTIEAKESYSVSEKLDHKGLPLIPQPSDDPEDPLNWSRRQNYLIVAITSLVAFMGTFALASANPAYAQIGLALGKTAREASYMGTISIASAGAIGIAAGFGSAFSKSYATLLVGLFFVGLGVASGNVVTFGMISDVFCLHKRGTMLGLVTVALINGPHFASLPGGFIAQYVGWEWTLTMASIETFIACVLIVIGLPETLYVRGLAHVPSTGKYHRLRITGTKAPGKHLRLVDFARPFQMLRFFPVVVVAMFAAVAFTLGSVMPAQTVSALFRTYYHWASARTGVALSVSTTIGGVLGEVVSGPVIDKLMERSRKREGHVRFAVQMITTPIIAYCVDCYKPQSAEVVQLLNFARQEISFTVGFWSLVYGLFSSPPPKFFLSNTPTSNPGEEVGFQFSGLTYACVSVLFFLPVWWIMIYGERLRKRLGQPNFNTDI
ncbi:major facilitator superfamily domain-containing protein [Mycena rebaudengoi]|nr:major facilitator superfamily domain-containing protein [Mycena rebaudengoi]